ncbi:ComF family protein [Granulicella paludicola]|uniref:ComF family protein n=1 Tax=Granulicella paludicola TaxID=474951 RepID=UPI0021E04C30|nr:ComF family protein [Granulicella paludicola]
MGFESARMMAAMGLSECTMCRLAPPEFERAVAADDYDEEMREMLHLLKFAGRRAVAEVLLGERLAAAIALLRDAAKELVVVPVPLFAARERERGYNQAELLAKAAVRRMSPKLKVSAGVLVRVKDTRPLYMLSPKQRRASLRGAFRVARPDAVIGREVLLVDDVMTTGATARECARVLKGAGATKVWVATAAKAQPAGSVAVYRESDVAMWSVGGSSPTSQNRDMGHPVKSSDGSVIKSPDVSKRREFW